MTDRALIPFDVELLERLQTWCAVNEVTVDAIIEVLLEDIEAPAIATKSELAFEPMAELDNEDLAPYTELAPKRRGRPRKPTSTPTDLVLERVIAHDVLVARLARDRAMQLADGGDAGGLVTTHTSAPVLIGPTDEKREVCSVHGWVGRFQFDRAHTTCALSGEACRRCEGRKYNRNGPCGWCGGSGIDRPSTAEIAATDPAHANEKHPLYRGHERATREESGVPRSKTTAPKLFTRAALEAGELEVAAVDSPDFVEPPRPRTRAECVGGMRPCPWVSCRHHLYLDVNPETGSIQIHRPDLEPGDLEYSCALDVADAGEHTLDIVGQVINVTRERVRQIEYRASINLRAALHGHLRITENPGPFVTDRGTEAA